MRSASFTDFRNNAKLFFDAVEKGESIEIYRHGKPIAVIYPSNDKARGRWKRANPRKVAGLELSSAILADRNE